MANKKILVSDKISDHGIYLLEKYCDVTFDPTITPVKLLKEIKKYDALIVRSRTRVTKKVLEAGDNLIIVGRAGVGVDNIDLEIAKANNIAVVNSPQATTNAVKEHTIGLLLSMMRNIPQGYNSIKQGEWAKSELVGSELSENSTLDYRAVVQRFIANRFFSIGQSSNPFRVATPYASTCFCMGVIQ